MRIKICGVRRLEDALMAAELGACAVGFVFWPDSPRFIDPDRARPIVAALPFGVTAVGVFVNQPPDTSRVSRGCSILAPCNCME
jgi:phosphoribosylanthranilate isomerase